MKAIIEKELCNPVNGQIVGPYYHLYSVDEEGNKTSLNTFNDIKDAAREAERQLDLDAIEVAYQRNPHSFESVVDLDNVSTEYDEFFEGPEFVMLPKVPISDEELDVLYLDVLYNEYCQSKDSPFTIEEDFKNGFRMAEKKLLDIEISE